MGTIASSLAATCTGRRFPRSPTPAPWAIIRSAPTKRLCRIWSGQTLPGGSLGFNYASFLLGAVDNYTIAQWPTTGRPRSSSVSMLRTPGRSVVSSPSITESGTITALTIRKSTAVPWTSRLPLPIPAPAANWAPSSLRVAVQASAIASSRRTILGLLGRASAGHIHINDKTVIRVGWGLIYGSTSINPLGINTAGIVNANAVGSPGLGTPAMTLAGGIPASADPTWPVFSPGVAPISPIGNQAFRRAWCLLDPMPAVLPDRTSGASAFSAKSRETW